MARIAGVATQKDTRGNITHITIDLKKHKEAVPVLKELGLMEKTQFEKECEGAITLEEFKQGLLDHIDSLPWKK
ncbi:MAG: hypothetical protein ABIX01_04925 [Chitinophagaceae bacterium]